MTTYYLDDDNSVTVWPNSDDVELFGEGNERSMLSLLGQMELVLVLARHIQNRYRAENGLPILPESEL